MCLGAAQPLRSVPRNSQCGVVKLKKQTRKCNSGGKWMKERGSPGNVETPPCQRQLLVINNLNWELWFTFFAQRGNMPTRFYIGTFIEFLCRLASPEGESASRATVSWYRSTLN